MKNYIVFTHHAKQRLREFQIPIQQAISMLQDAEKEKSPPKDKYENLLHYRFGTVIFTGKFQQDRFDSQKEIFLVVTVYDQRLNLPAHLL